MKNRLKLILLLTLSVFQIHAQTDTLSKKSFADNWTFIGKAVEEKGYHIWGTSPIWGDDGKVHLFVARWKKEYKVDPEWRSKSEIAHYIGEKPEGPFTFSDIVLQGTGKETWDKYGIHNPNIHKIGDNYVLLYIANSDFHQPPHPSNQCIGMVISKKLNGPWEKVNGDGKILSPPTNPNIIIFLVDDMGWQDCSLPFWDKITPLNQKFHTPNMERLARNGMKFTNAYANPVCTPTRVSLMTGMNEARHNVTNWTDVKKNSPTDNPDSILIPSNWNYNGMSPVPNIEKTVYATPLPKLLSEAGYFTVHCGKAHFAPYGTPAADPSVSALKKI